MRDAISTLPRRIVLLYVLFAGVWITFSDQLLAVLRVDPITAEWLQTLKGWAFVGISAVLLYAQLRRELRMRQHTETALHQSEQRYRRIVETTEEGIWMIDADNQTTFVNQKMADMLGYTVAEMRGAPLFAFMDAEGQAIAKAGLERRRQGIREQIEAKFQRKDSEVIWALVATNPVEDAAGRYAGALAMVTDITERKLAESALQESEERFRCLSEATFEGIVINDQGQHLAVNAAFVAMMGYSYAEANRMNALDFTAPEYHALVLEKIHSGDEQPYETVDVRKDGSRFPAEVRGRNMPYQGRMVRVIAVRDITERKQAEQALRESEERFRRLSEATFEGIGICGNDRILDANTQLAEMVGYTHPELIGMPTDQLVAPESRSLVREYVQGGQLDRYEHLALRKDGSVFPVEVRSRPLPEQGLNMRVTIVRDISERVATQHALAQSEQRFRTMFERAAIGIALVDMAGHPIVSNPAMEALLGYRADELREMTFAMFTHPDDVDADLALFDELLGGARESYQLEKRYLRKDGQVVWGRLTASLIVSNGAEPHLGLGMIEDITERKRIEQQYLQAQKMDALGRLAGGVAHDFNNLLTVILGSSELLLDELGRDHPLCRDVVPIQNAAAHAAALTRQLLTFSHHQVRQLDIVNLNTVVVRLETLLRRSLGEDVTLITRLAADLEPVQIDVSQLEQVLLNLAVNARDAMPNGGMLIIETAQAVLDTSDVPERGAVTTDPYVLLAISDTGCGMDAATQARMFEPFFTTKAPGKGTGLGLSTVYGIVRQSGGYLWVYSEVGQGTTFKIYLPQTRAQAKTSQPLPELARIARDSGTILLVEDEPSVRALASRILRARGYAVLEAEDGATALRIASGHQGWIDVLLTDVIMPGGMSGPQLAEQLLGQRPGLRVLYMSGYTDTAIAHHTAFDPRQNLLQKPFTAGGLAHRIWNMLHTREWE
jgi:two-component system, cell cycle sensor histidine kinase and response regulator CckA